VGRFPLAGLLFELLGDQIRLLFALHELPRPFSITIKIAELEINAQLPRTFMPMRLVDSFLFGEGVVISDNVIK
jgi:hypothetical protein